MNDLSSIERKVALVTGGGSGIGWMIAEAYARAGAKVYIASRKQAELEARLDILVNNAGAYVNAAVIPVDGGISGTR